MENQSDLLSEEFAVIDQMAARWQSSIVARKKVGEFSGGAISAKTLANLDSQGKGPEGSFVLCGQRVYPVTSLIKYLKDRVTLKWNRSAPAKRSEG